MRATDRSARPGRSVRALERARKPQLSFLGHASEATSPREIAPTRAGRGGTDRRLLVILGAAGLALVVVVAVGAVVAFGGGGTNAAAALDKAGCTLLEQPALRGVHSITTPTGTSPLWNTSPPTRGPHYEIPAVWGAYTEPLNMAQLVHNLEHGGIYILYGPQVPDVDVAQLGRSTTTTPDGTILAPLPSLGDKIALGAWTTKDANDPDERRRLTSPSARRSTRPRSQRSSTQLQFQGPERFPADTLLPGRN